MAVLECRHLTKRYGNLTALDNIDLSLEPGRIVGLVGPNGSGKTTLIKLAQHLLTPTDGEILIDGIRYPICPTEISCRPGWMWNPCCAFMRIFTKILIRTRPCRCCRL